MIDKILVPVDGSENSLKALRYACWLCQKVEAKISVLYVVNVPYTGESAFLHIDSLLEMGQKVLEKARETVKEEKCAVAHFELRQGIGNPGHGIIKFGKEGDFSLIVVGATGHTALSHLLMGSVSDLVTHHAACPVLIIR